MSLDELFTGDDLLLSIPSFNVSSTIDSSSPCSIIFRFVTGVSIIGVDGDSFSSGCCCCCIFLLFSSGIDVGVVTIGDSFACCCCCCCCCARGGGSGAGPFSRLTTLILMRNYKLVNF